MRYNVVVVGGGPAGLGAAVEAKRNGAKDVLIIERDRELGGILNQCIHNGFGLHEFKEELTGPEYAHKFIEMVKEEKIDYMLDTMVLNISEDKTIEALGEEGIINIQADAIVLAMGCRERTRGAIDIPGYRPAGVYNAGAAQRLSNMEGYMVGKEIVIYG
ncbi:MAG: FAD/NAD(P)-binding oxidoreductase, partial [Clostridiales bacterium]|nr:FAD/NAD(P)-binding oxidoreductase [Clostridiales bacterium]